ncbi:MAG TPA: dehydrogenase, partial [Albitalea sp.]|nr:dehydrogenase [Albitalea sp.]
MKNVISISLGASSRDFQFTCNFLGSRLRVHRLGTDGSTARAIKLVKEWGPRAAAIGLGFSEDDTPRLRQAAGGVPLTRGARLSEIFLEWAVRHAQTELGHCFDNARVLFLSGSANQKLATTLAEYTDNLQFAEALQSGVPSLLPEALSRPWTQATLHQAMRDATVLVAPVHELDGFGIEELAGKTLITATVNDERVAHFKNKGVNMVVDGSPLMQGHVLAPDLLDAMILAASGKAPDKISEDDYLEIIGALQTQPRIIYPNGFRRMNRFAFVIHPLSQEYFKVVKPIEVLSHVSPPLFMDSLEKLMAYAPPFVYSRVEGIRSPTGVEAEGWLISVGGTPKEIMGHSPEFTYSRLLAAADMAKKLGAQIMGLGAFTKVIGDAGLTVARRAPLPITTGNSYSASGALWAAHDALLRLRLLPRPKGRNRVHFKAMVVGATGAIGSVCSRLLAAAVKDVVLVSIEPPRLEALKRAILEEVPDATVVTDVSTAPWVGQCDLIVTATSAFGLRVLDVSQCKPGAVILDVALPPDISAEEAGVRPDVLVVESGEVLIP